MSNRDEVREKQVHRVIKWAFSHIYKRQLLLERQKKKSGGMIRPSDADRVRPTTGGTRRPVTSESVYHMDIRCSRSIVLTAVKKAEITPIPAVVC
jgi:hypothetical protein